MIEVVTVATEPHGGFQLFADSCATHGIQPHVIEQGSEWRGFAWRFKAVIRYLRTLQSEFVLHSDCFDAIALAPLEVAQAKFDALGHPWVFSWQPDLLGRPEPFLNLCAGLWMGRREYILDTITDAWMDEIFPDHFNDEFQLQLMLALSPGLFALDAGSTLFYSSPDLNPVVGPAWMHCIVQG
jgi:hypothetical protein